METELKFEVDPATAERLIEELGLSAEGEDVILKSVYYDTKKSRLRDQGIALRVRDDGSRLIQTVKSDGAVRRGEWEQEIAGPRPDLAATSDSPLAKLLKSKDGASLRPAFEVTVERTRRNLPVGDGIIEVAVDRGAVNADGYGTPICEIELELKSGAPALLFALARELTARGALELSFTSKAERGYALIDGAPLAAVKARKPVLTADDDTGRAFQAIAASNLIQITGNARVLRAARRPEAVHQLRVGVRRLRTAIGLFGPMLADDRREDLKTELKWLTGELDAARNLDVFIAETFRPAAKAHPNIIGLAALGAGLLTAQTEAYDRVEDALRSQRFGRLTLDVTAWVEAGTWATSDDPAFAALRARPAEGVAAEILAHRHRKVIQRGRKLETLDPTARHHLRIQAKKLRYAGDFFAPLYQGGAARRLARLSKALAGFQDRLGALNDIAVGAGLAAQVVGADPGAKTGRKADPAQAFAAGQVYALRQAESAGTLEAALEAYRELAAAKPYW